MDMNVDQQSQMNLSCKELQVLLLHEFRLGREATEGARNICRTMGEDILSICTAQHWYNRFKSGNFKLDDSRHSRRALEVDVDVSKQLIEEDFRLTTPCLAGRLRCSHTTVETPERIRQDVEIWSLDTTLFITASRLILVWHQ